MKKTIAFIVASIFILFGSLLSSSPALAADTRCMYWLGGSLEGHDFSNCDLTNANLDNANLANANLTGANLTNANLDNANLANANLTGANLKNARLISANLTNSNLTNSNLTNALLTWANLANANLDGTNFTGATIPRISSGGVSGTPAALPVGWKLISGFFIGAGADLTRANLANSDLTGVRSGYISGRPTSLPVGWVLTNGFLIGPGADLSSTSVTSDGSGTPVSLDRVDLSNSYVGSIYVTSLVGANLTGTDMSATRFDTGYKSGGIFGQPLRMRAGWKVINGYLVGPGANIDQANLIDGDLTGVKSGEITGTPSALPPNWDLVNGYLIGPGADLTESDLTDADLSGKDLDGATLTGANLTNTNLTGAKLGVISGNLRGIPSFLPSNYRLVSGYLIGPKVVIRNALFGSLDFRGLDLSNADFGYSNLGNLYLVGANFTNTNLNGATLREITNANLTNASLIEANLSNANLTDANLTNASLIRANLSNANLTNATVSGTIFTAGAGAVPYFDATLTGIISSGLVGTPDSLPSGYVLDDGKICRLMVNHPKPLLRHVKPELVNPMYNVETSYYFNPEENGWDAGVQLSFQWFRDNSPIPKATGQTYTPIISDVNKRLSLAVTGSKTGYKPFMSVSDQQIVQPGQMSVTAPKIVGTIKVGKTIQVKISPWVPGALISTQWLLDGKPIKGATKGKYLISKTNKKHRISVKITQSKTGFQTVSITSPTSTVG